MDRFRKPLAFEKVLDLKMGGDRDFVLPMVDGAIIEVPRCCCCWRSSSGSSSTIVDVLGTMVLAMNVFFSGLVPLIDLFNDPISS